MNLRTLPRAASGPQSNGWWGMVWLLVIEGMVIGSFIVSWFYLRLYNPRWPPPNIPLPEVLEPGLRTILLFVGAALLIGAARAVAPTAGRTPEDTRRRVLVGLLGGAIPVLAYIAVGAWDLATQDLSWRVHVYASMYWMITGYALLHAVTLLGLQGVVGALALAGHAGRDRPVPVQIVALYGGFVAVTSLLTWLTLHVGPYLM